MPVLQSLGDAYKDKWWRCRMWKGRRHTDKNGTEVYVNHVR